MRMELSVTRLLQRALLMLCVSLAFAGHYSMAEENDSALSATASAVSKSKAETLPWIAVADLAYEKKVSEFIFQYNRNTSANNNNYAKSGGDGNKSGFDSQLTSVESVSAGTYIKMERAELRRFTSDIKGELLKSNKFRVTQAKPWLQDESPSLFDVLERAKNGYFPSSDLVLFGIVNNLEFRTETNQIAGSSSKSHGLYLEMVIEFSLIDLKTNEVVASFTASGEGQEVKLGGTLNSNMFNKANVIQQASQELGRNVANQILEQYPQ